MKINITYCVECGYLPIALRLAEGIKAELDISPELEAGHGGILAVKVGDDEVFNNLREGGFIPPDVRIIDLVRAAIEPASTGGGAKHLLHDVMNPMGYPPHINPMAMAPRPTSLEGKTVYLVDARFDDSDRFLIQM